MLLTRLSERATRLSGPAFHRDRRCHWQLDIDSATGRGSLHPLIDQDGKGAVHVVPMMARSSDTVPLLGCDNPHYVLGWGSHRQTAARHRAFVDLLARWAAEEPSDRDAHVVSDFYTHGGVTGLTVVPEVVDQDVVILLSVDNRPVHTAATAAKFWFCEVTRVKGLGREGQCLVCGSVAALAKTIPNLVPGYLVPEAASSGAALVTVNVSSMGYAGTVGLEHTPICMSCADAIVQGLTAELSSPHSRSGLGQSARSTWWTTVEDVLTGASWVEQPPSAADIAYFVDSVRKGTLVTPPEGAMFCTLTVTGSIGRISVTDWREYTIGTIRRHIADWWDDHQIATTNQRPYFSITRLVEACGRWDTTSGHYLKAPDAAVRKNDPHRPPWLRHDLVRTAYQGTVPPAALIGHLLHRIRSDHHIDAPRAALLRLAHNRSRKDDRMPPGLDLTRADPAYLAGRVFALHAAVQDAAHRSRGGAVFEKGDGQRRNDSRDNAGSQDRINSTYADRYYSGAITSPRTAVAAGQRDLSAWLKVLRRTKPGLAHWFETQIASVMERAVAEDDFPVVASLGQQSQFILGYWHQRAYRSAPRADADPSTTPQQDVAVNVDGDAESQRADIEQQSDLDDPFAALGITV